MIKNTIALISFLFIINNLASQSVFLGIGFNSTSIKNRNINRILERYNNITTWGSDFETYTNISGIVIDASQRRENNMISMGWYGRHKNSSVEGTDELGADRVIDLRHRYNYGYLNWFWHFVDHRRFKMGPGLGVGFGTYKISRANSRNDSEYDYYDVIREHQFNTSILFNISLYMGSHVSLNIQPYFQIPVLNNTKVQFGYLENDLNPSYEVPIDEMGSYEEWTITYGFAVTLSFGGGD